jgi:general secretion pathway protein G
MDESRRNRFHAGFTLIELLIVVAVIAIIVAIAIPNLIAALQRARQSSTLADIRLIGEGLELYQKDHSRYPIVAGGTAAELGGHLNLYIRSFNPRDGWGEPLSYESDGTFYTVVSTGLDKVVDLPYSYGPTDSFDADIVFAGGAFIQWPEGPQGY